MRVGLVGSEMCIRDSHYPVSLTELGSFIININSSLVSGQQKPGTQEHRKCSSYDNSPKVAVGYYETCVCSPCLHLNLFAFKAAEHFKSNNSLTTQQHVHLHVCCHRNTKKAKTTSQVFTLSSESVFTNPMTQIYNEK